MYIETMKLKFTNFPYGEKGKVKLMLQIKGLLDL